MGALAFDTYKAVKALTAAGANEALAEAVVATVGAAASDNVATKTDIARVETSLRGDMPSLKPNLRPDWLRFGSS